jgi:NAD(P)-dependent dehydrogenase (short-subunit alcohol dehydrogenase family)
MSLAGRVCVVTGGGNGIGRAICARVAADGGIPVAWDIDPAAADAATAPHGGSGHEADVRDRDALEAALAATVERHGPVDILVNNAGVALAGPTETFPDEQWDDSIGIMQTGVFRVSQIVGRAMLERRRGTIVNISSINAWEAFPMRLAYCAAKAAVVAMTEVLAIEWADRGIRVNAVAPGVTRTELVQKGIDDGVVDVDRYIARTPQHRFGEPDDIARAVCFLADDEAAGFITGSTLTVDGGWSAQGWIIR